MKPMAHRDRDIVPEDPRMRAYWKYHVDGHHKIPREGVQPDHFYACSWCRPQWSALSNGTYGYLEGEWEQFLLPQSAAGNPMAAVAGRLG